eukprot:m.443937 g.443937  ORF g.443937 m.443937 type:complete len:56 (+) comp139356_c0_seq1:43-210(+)
MHEKNLVGPPTEVPTVGTEVVVVKPEGLASNPGQQLETPAVPAVPTFNSSSSFEV